MPTVANLNLYRGRFSRVAWHGDNEPLFGVRGESKLIVSLSFGTRACFKWKGESCSDSEAKSCWLDHGDLLVMDGQCQDEFLHRTDPGLEQERINVTFRWIKQHVATCPFLRTGVACCLPACAQGSGVLALLIYPLVCVEPGFAGVPVAGHALRGRHCLRGSLGVHQITVKCATFHDGIICSTGYCWKLPYMPVFVRLPSPHDNYAYMVSWNKGALREKFADGYTVRPLFFSVWGFLLC